MVSPPLSVLEYRLCSQGMNFLYFLAQGPWLTHYILQGLGIVFQSALIIVRLRRLAGQVGLSPENCRKVQAACVQAAVLFGSELWWKGDGIQGTIGRQEDIQKLVNQEAR